MVDGHGHHHMVIMRAADRLGTTTGPSFSRVSEKEVVRYSRVLRRPALTFSARANEVAEENAVNAVTVALLVVGALTFVVGIADLQAKLERWDYQRHAQD
jgi:hypothetical protein